MRSREYVRFSHVVVERSSSTMAESGTSRERRYRAIASASEISSSEPCPPDGMKVPRFSCLIHRSYARSTRPRSNGVSSVPFRPAPWITMKSYWRLRGSERYSQEYSSNAVNDRKNHAPQRVIANRKPRTNRGAPRIKAAGTARNHATIAQAKSSGSPCDSENPSRRTNCTSLTSMKMIVMNGAKAIASAIGSVIHH